MIIYVLKDPRNDEIRYVGKSIHSSDERLARHLWPSSLTGNNHRERWIYSLVKQNLKPKIEVLEICQTPDELSKAEIFHIDRLIRMGVSLTNETPGGDGGGWKHTEESKEKIRKALTGKKKSEEHRRNIVLANTGRKATEETREKLRKIHSAKREPLGEKWRIAISKGKKGKPFMDQHGNIYQTQKGAARKLHINVGHLNQVLHGSRSHVAGYIFRFIPETVREFPR